MKDLQEECTKLEQYQALRDSSPKNKSQLVENDSFHDIQWKSEISHANTNRIFQEEGIAEEALAAAQNKATNLRCKCDTSHVCFYMKMLCCHIGEEGQTWPCRVIRVN